MSFTRPNNIVRVNDLSPVDFTQDAQTGLLHVSPELKNEIIASAVASVQDDVDDKVAAASTDPVNVSTLMASMAVSANAITVTDAFGNVIFHGLPV